MLDSLYGSLTRERRLRVDTAPVARRRMAETSACRGSARPPYSMDGTGPASARSPPREIQDAAGFGRARLSVAPLGPRDELR